MECIPLIDINKLASTIFIGELSLDGKVNRTNGILPMCIEAKELGMYAWLYDEDRWPSGSCGGAVSLPAGAGRADHQLHPWTEHCHPLRREAGGTGDRVRV